jgi:HK97 family phage portal protein
MRFAGGSGSWPTWSFAGPTQFNYNESVGDGTESSIVMATVGWLTRTFPESPVIIELDTPDGPEQIFVHDAIRLINRPNPFYSGKHLWKGTVADYNVSGNAYWLKIRSSTTKLVQLWWVPSSLMEPKWDDAGLEFITHYEYKPDGITPYRVEPNDVVHFRNGFDSENIRKGASPLKSLLREIFTDDEASQFTSSILRNLGVPGVLISPGDSDVEITQEQAEQLKANFQYKFNGERRGEPMVLGAKANVTVLSFSPEQMNLRELRKIPEERVTAVIGVSAMAVGLGAGLDRSTFTNYGEARLAAYESNIIPTQGLFGAELDLQYLPDFAGISEDHHMKWDNSDVRVLQDDEDAKTTRAMAKLAGGALSLNEARVEMGHPELPDGNVFYIPMSVTVTPEDELVPDEPEPPVLPSGPPALPSGEEDNVDTEADDLDDAVDDLEDATKSFRRAQQKRALRGVVPGIIRVRKRVTPSCQRAVTRFLNDQRDRIIASITDGKHLEWYVGILSGQQQRVKADILDKQTEDDALAKVLNPYYLRTLSGVHEVVTSALGTSFDLDDPITRSYLASAGTRITKINENTLTKVRTQLQQGQALGEAQDSLAKRIQTMPEFGKARSNMIARTEMGAASNRAARTNYVASNVVAGIEVDDGDDDEECSQMHGRRFSLDEMDNVEELAHPNCVRAFLPLTDVDDLDDRRGNINDPNIDDEE